MTEVRRQAEKLGIALPGEELAVLEERCPPALLQAACCFWCFRALHSEPSPERALLGDYCFGRFSEHLAALDNVELNDAFALFLAENSSHGAGFGAYLSFLERAEVLL